jgi:poly(A) polymerase
MRFSMVARGWSGFVRLKIEDCRLKIQVQAERGMAERRTPSDKRWYNVRPMVEPRIIPRAEHTISRRDIDPDALKVLYRLHEHHHLAYLVGGSVRDLLLGRRPKDFDIGTSAQPGQVKKLFRNCWIIGRRFRLAHVKFGTKVIEVATFRRQVQAPGDIVETPEVTEPVQVPEAADLPRDPMLVPPEELAAPSGDRALADAFLIHRDNTFGTPEEDAFRRDFTINALFYDIATFTIIDYVSGMDDLRAGLVRSIGDPEVRFREDPVRMLRAVALAARLGFAIDPPVHEAIRLHRHEIAKSSPARLLEEYYKILRSGYAEKTFRALAGAGLLEPVSSELHQGAGDPLWRSLAEIDAYRGRFDQVPDTLTNAILLGSLLVPLDFSARYGAYSDALPRLGALPLARRDVDRLRQLLGLQRRLRDTGAHARAKHALTHRHVFGDALTWLDIHGGAPELVAHWRAILAERGSEAPPAQPGEGEPPPFRRRRRRRRRRYRPVQ